MYDIMLLTNNNKKYACKQFCRDIACIQNRGKNMYDISSVCDNLIIHHLSTLLCYKKIRIPYLYC